MKNHEHLIIKLFNLVVVQLLLVNILSASNTIEICNWKYGAAACINISFDDNYTKWKQMSEILNDYNFKGTFFCPTKSFKNREDSLFYIFNNGHEIGSHSFSHISLKEFNNDTTGIIFELKKSREMIENLFGERCHSFAEPLHGRTELSKNLISQHYSFLRNDAFIYNAEDILLPYATLTIDGLINSIQTAIINGSFIRLYGHSIDGEGPGPITKDLFVESLDVIKSYSDDNKVWVTTLHEGGLYQKVKSEINLELSIVQDTLILEVLNFNEDDYLFFDDVPISIKIPKGIFKSVIILNDADVEITDEMFSHILTFDLLANNTVKILNDDTVTGYSTCSRGDHPFVVYPNPATDYIRFSLSDNIISKKIFNLNGQLIAQNIDNKNFMSVSYIKPGLYILELTINHSSSEYIYKQIIQIQ